MAAKIDKSSIVCRVFSVGDFREASNPFDGLSDPHHYLASHSPEGIRLLLSNPYARDSDPALAIVIHKKTVVGRLAFYTGPAPIWSSEKRVLWLSGFFLDTRYRDTGAGGLLLLRALSNQSDLIGAGAPSAELEAVYDRLGFCRLGPLHRWVHFYNARILIARFISLAWLQVFLGALVTPFLRAYQLVHPALEPMDGLSFQRVDRFPDDLDKDIETGDMTTPFARGATLWNWILRFSTDLQPYLISRDGRPYGYCVLRDYAFPGGGSHNLPPMQIGELVDYQVPHDSATANLLAFAIGQLRKAGCDVFELQCKHPAMEENCARNRLFRIGGYRIFFWERKKDASQRNQDWHFTSAVADMTLSSPLQNIQG